jgi:hypothetical protein
MIVRHDGDHSLLITQPDHAHLAGFVMAHCTALSDHPRRREILRAVTDHDAGWGPEDAAPRLNPDTREIADFIGSPAEVRQGVWPRTVAMLADGDPWAAALVAQHAITVYNRLHANPDWQPFFERMAELRDELVLEGDLTLEDLEADYVFVRLGDLISLMFCTRSDDLNQFAGWSVTRTDDRVFVDPDLFGGATIPIEISARVLPRQRFPSNEALRAALRDAETTTLRGVVSGR